MSWLEKIQYDLIVKTGDGTEFRPDWTVASKSRSFNTAAFNFPRKEGTKIDRFQPQGLKYDIEWIFQGEDHLDAAEEFDQASKDPRPWTVRHPKYGSLLVQPLDLSYDDSAHNVTVISGTIAETISDQGPDTSVQPVALIESEKSSLDAAAVEDFKANANPNPSLEDVEDLSSQIEAHFAEVEGKIKDATKFSQVKQTFEEATRLAKGAIEAPGAAMDGLQRMVNTPARLSQSVKSKMDILQQSFNKVRDRFNSKDDPSSSEKVNYEFGQVANISAQCLASVKSEPGDYQSRRDVFAVTDQILANADLLKSDLNAAQDDNTYSNSNYVPSHSVQRGLSETLSKTLAKLSSIALNTQQERFVQLKQGDSPINLAHKYYGISDESLERFLDTNRVGMEEFFWLPEGRYILFYV